MLGKYCEYKMLLDPAVCELAAALISSQYFIINSKLCQTVITENNQSIH